MSRSEKGVSKFKEGFNCSQSVLFSYADRLGISEDNALKIMTGFGAGMGRRQEICGAVSGGIAVLSMLYGRTGSDDKQKTDETYDKTRKLIEAFISNYGTVNCLSLLGGCRLLSEEGQQRFKDENMIKHCYDFVRFVIEHLENEIKEDR
ncbi:MAG: C-GCAxxG-C-C family protein [Spirochaetes bacterium]|jgi:C_GCAxxG_C_C family probable redox protein|nr:C-GCAxxG-C-C family protein [Spirochaetota bacterium]